jgi:hypothetical protein
MEVARLPIIEDVQTLRAMVLQLMVERDAAIATVTQREAALAALQEQIARMNRWRFSRRAEALDPAQRALFDEHLAEDTARAGTDAGEPAEGTGAVQAIHNHPAFLAA